MERISIEDIVNNSKLVPANFGPGCDANGNARLLGPCGDTFEFWLRIKDDVIGPVEAKLS